VKISYLRRIETIENCHICNGHGQRWETEYHNQTVQTACFYCNGRGERPSVEETDITPEIVLLLKSAKKRTKPKNKK
jgi:hypothetical protein